MPVARSCMEGMGPQWEALAADWHRMVWFAVGDCHPTPEAELSKRKVWTRTGTRPGCPLADLVSVLGFAVVQK